MRVQRPFGVRFAVKRRAVPAHGIGEAGFKQIVVARGELFQCQRQIGALGGG